jgi:hypothetical protein
MPLFVRLMGLWDIGSFRLQHVQWWKWEGNQDEQLGKRYLLYKRSVVLVLDQRILRVAKRPLVRRVDSCLF